MQKGYTFLELVVVMAIVGILAVGVTAMFIDYQGIYLEMAAQKMQADVGYARSLCMTKRGTTFGVFFDDSEDTYTVYENDVSTPVPDPIQEDIDPVLGYDPMIEDFSKFPGVGVVDGDYLVEFNEFGELTAGFWPADARISNGTKTYQIEPQILSDTGRVTLTVVAGGCTLIPYD